MLRPDNSMRALEIGTGSCYQTAILSCLCKEVFSVEMIDLLASRTIKILESEGIAMLQLKQGMDTPAGMNLLLMISFWSPVPR